MTLWITEEVEYNISAAKVKLPDFYNFLVKRMAKSEVDEFMDDREPVLKKVYDKRFGNY